MKRLWIFVLAVLVLTAFTGCRQKVNSLENKVDAIEETLEQKVDAIEQKIEEAATFAPVAPDQLITPEEAQAIALEHAGVTAEEVIGLHAVMEIDDGRQEYEVEFRVGHLEYDYEIDAATGQIISFDKDN